MDLKAIIKKPKVPVKKVKKNKSSAIPVMDIVLHQVLKNKINLIRAIKFMSVIIKISKTTKNKATEPNFVSGDDYFHSIIHFLLKCPNVSAKKRIKR